MNAEEKVLLEDLKKELKEVKEKLEKKEIQIGMIVLAIVVYFTYMYF